MKTKQTHHKHVAGVIAERRNALGLSREALGQAAGGISSSTIRRIENGAVNPHPSTTTALYAALNAAELTEIES
jgi:predicted transcriptional regulator